MMLLRTVRNAESNRNSLMKCTASMGSMSPCSNAKSSKSMSLSSQLNLRNCMVLCVNFPC